jgi:undecaprenyl diphosphate synthase
LEGHKLGVHNIRPVVEMLSGYGVQYVTLYAFSTENWNRPAEEVDGLMSILQGAIGRETKVLHNNNVRVIHLGRTDRISTELHGAVRYAEDLTQNNTGITLCVAFDYGGRVEILQAVTRMIEEGVSPDSVDEELFSHFLYTDGIPDPDLIIRTGGELRLSNFLLWQSAYSEYYTTQTPWPALSSEDIELAIEAYTSRQRRFGMIEA